LFYGIDPSYSPSPLEIKPWECVKCDADAHKHTFTQAHKHTYTHTHTHTHPPHAPMKNCALNKKPFTMECFLSYWKAAILTFVIIYRFLNWAAGIIPSNW
jgi:hypothetical protein